MVFLWSTILSSAKFRLQSVWRYTAAHGNWDARARTAMRRCLPPDLQCFVAGVRRFGGVAIGGLGVTGDVAGAGYAGGTFAQHLGEAIENFRAGIAQCLVGRAQQRFNAILPVLVEPADRSHDPGIGGGLQAILEFCGSLAAHPLQLRGPLVLVLVALVAKTLER